MIILDTNVISEMMRTIPHPDVLTWLAFQPREAVFTTAISQAEVLAGLRAMPAGKRRQQFEAQAVAMFYNDFAGRVLPFDGDAAERYGSLTAHRSSIGRPINQLDAQISGIALARGASLATRNIRDFEHLELDLINPWDFRA